MNPKRWEHFEEEALDFDRSVRLCDHPGCTAEGSFPAPKSRSALNEYNYFCLEHVQAYNRAWNFYEGMDAEQIEHDRRADLLWRRRTRPFAAGGGGSQADGVTLEGVRFGDPFGLFEQASEGRSQDDMSAQLLRSLPLEIREALLTLDLRPPVTADVVKKRYKELAKKLHPDINKGDAASEDRLKEVNQAYALVKTGVAVGV